MTLNCKSCSREVGDANREWQPVDDLLQVSTSEDVLWEIDTLFVQSIELRRDSFNRINRALYAEFTQ